MAKTSSACALCGKNAKTCEHPWDQAFEFWPDRLKNELRVAVATGR